MKKLMRRYLLMLASAVKKIEANARATTLFRTFAKMTVSAFFQKVQIGITNIWENVTLKTSGIKTFTKNVIGEILPDVHLTVSSFFQKVQTKITNIWGNVHLTVISFSQKVQIRIANIWENVTLKTSGIKTLAMNIVGEILQDVHLITGRATILEGQNETKVTHRIILIGKRLAVMLTKSVASIIYRVKIIVGLAAVSSIKNRIQIVDKVEANTAEESAIADAEISNKSRVRGLSGFSVVSKITNHIRQRFSASVISTTFVKISKAQLESVFEEMVSAITGFVEVSKAKSESHIDENVSSQNAPTARSSSYAMLLNRLVLTPFRIAGDKISAKTTFLRNLVLTKFIVVRGTLKEAFGEIKTYALARIDITKKSVTAAITAHAQSYNIAFAVTGVNASMKFSNNCVSHCSLSVLDTWEYPYRDTDGSLVITQVYAADDTTAGELTIY